jgi:hypothetical protein
MQHKDDKLRSDSAAASALSHLNAAIGYQARIQEFLVEVNDMDDEKIGRGLGAVVGPQRGSGAEPLVGVKGAKLPMKVTLFHELYSDFALSK